MSAKNKRKLLLYNPSCNILDSLSTNSRNTESLNQTLIKSHEEMKKLCTKSLSSNLSKDTHRVIRFDENSRPDNYILDFDSIQKYKQTNDWIRITAFLKI